KIMTDEDFPVGTQLSPVIQFHQRDPHHAVFQIGSNYFNEKVSDLQALEISCRRQPCDGAVTRRPAQPIS
ncbi:MAG: hypothetical protein HKN70_03450, partial [Gammaproteobacteria bacterium]|nr:hypothetical protein [Gammaproteobacteria bacterium]